jgi:two-component system, LytTR family, response regulator
MMGIRALIVDDERIARRDLRELLVTVPDVSVVGEAGSLEEATRMIREHDPELVFLDIQLGRESGFDLLSGKEARFEVIFVTAFDQHALRAFDLGAAHYLLKPVEPAKLRTAIKRILSHDVAPRDATPFKEGDRLFVKVVNTWRFIEIRAIRYIEADGDYSTVYLADGTNCLLSRPMREWEVRLPERLFRRIHRSTIVNLEFVVKVEEWSVSTFYVHVRGSAAPLKMSRRYAVRLKQ